MKNIYQKIGLPFLFAAALWLQSCEDEPPMDYIAETYIEGYLIVGEPIQNIIVMRTQPLDENYSYEKSLIRDADVKIIGDSREFILGIDPEGENGYYDPGGEYLVKSGITYKLEVIVDDELITAETTTPPATEWTELPQSPLQYPKDTLNLPATDYIGWKAVPDYHFYLISVKCLDTLEYGNYLDPPTNEMNRRLERDWMQDEAYRDKTSWAFIANNRTSVVWNTFKWFGRHEVTVFVPDWPMMEWFIQQSAKYEYDPLLSNIEGKGFGVFGSAYAIRDTFFLLKNQP